MKSDKDKNTVSFADASEKREAKQKDENEKDLSRRFHKAMGWKKTAWPRVEKTSRKRKKRKK